MDIINRGSHPSHKFRTAHILLNCDEGDFVDKVTHAQISKEIHGWANGFIV